MQKMESINDLSSIMVPGLTDFQLNARTLEPRLRRQAGSPLPTIHDSILVSSMSNKFERPGAVPIQG